MTTRLLAAVLSLVLVAACSNRGESATTTEGTTSTAAPSTTTVTTSSTTTTTTTALEAEPAGIGDEYFPHLGNPGYDVSHYLLDLFYDPETRMLDAEVVVEAAATTDLATFNLDFAGFEISSVSVDGGAARFAREDGELTIAPQALIPAGESFAVAVSYSGIPNAVPSAAFPDVRIGWSHRTDHDFVQAEPDGAHSWFPCNDHPTDKATYTFRVAVPSGVVAAANGTLVDVVEDEATTTWIWELGSPMATYLATLVIGDYEIVEDEPGTADAGVMVRNVLPPPAGDWTATLSRQGEMMSWLAELFGPYPFEAHGVAVVDGHLGALENQTLSVFDRVIVDGSAGGQELLDIVLVHEIAHQWFGNLVALGRWKDTWLKEGIASYAEWLWVEREEGRDAMESRIRAERAQLAGAVRVAPGDPPREALYGFEVYRIGAMVFHALRLTVGDDTFFEILTVYLDRFAGSHAVTEDFIAVAEAVSDRDLDEFFDAWLYQIPVPEFPNG